MVQYSSIFDSTATAIKCRKYPIEQKPALTHIKLSKRVRQKYSLAHIYNYD